MPDAEWWTSHYEEAQRFARTLDDGPEKTRAFQLVAAV
jgi:hypothetical protein